jgi:hypothetical protein
MNKSISFLEALLLLIPIVFSCAEHVKNTNIQTPEKQYWEVTDSLNLNPYLAGCRGMLTCPPKSVP